MAVPRLVIGTGKVGIASPLTSNGRGGLLRSSGEGQLKKIIRSNLQDCDSDNPFQSDLGIGNGHIYGLNNEDAQSELRIRIKALFKRLSLENRASLLPPVVFTTIGEELTADINYINLEENKQDMVTLSRAEGGALTLR
jgi:hypothetical protein